MRWYDQSRSGTKCGGDNDWRNNFPALNPEESKCLHVVRWQTFEGLMSDSCCCCCCHVCIKCDVVCFVPAHLWQMCDNIINHRVYDAIRPARRICVPVHIQRRASVRSQSFAAKFCISFVGFGLFRIKAKQICGHWNKLKCQACGCHRNFVSVFFPPPVSRRSLSEYHFGAPAHWMIRRIRCGVCVCVGVYSARTISHAQRVVANAQLVMLILDIERNEIGFCAHICQRIRYVFLSYALCARHCAVAACSSLPQRDRWSTTCSALTKL